MRASYPLLAVTAALLLGGCARIAPVADAVVAAPRQAVNGTVEFFEHLFDSPQQTVEAVEIGRSQQCNSQGRESVINLFTDAAQLKAWEDSRGVQLTAVTASLPPGLYAIAEMGERNTGGYALAISRQAAASEGTLYLKATYLHPSVTGMATQVLTAPCSLVAIRTTQTFSSATLLDQANKVRAVWTLAGASAPVVAPLSTPLPPLTEPAPGENSAPAVEVLKPGTLASPVPAPAGPTVEQLPLPVRTPDVSPMP